MLGQYKLLPEAHSQWQRPYHVENTGSRPITEDKQRWVWLVLGWVTAWEYQMLLSFLQLKQNGQYRSAWLSILTTACYTLLFSFDLNAPPFVEESALFFVN